MRQGIALGCGGTLGAAWTIGVLAALQHAEALDPHDAAVIIGTSAGAEYGAMLAAGVTVDELLAAHRGTTDAPGWLTAHLAGAPPAIPTVPRPRLLAPHLLAAAIRGRVPLLTGLAGILPAGTGSEGRIRALAARLAGTDGWVAHPGFRAVAVDLASGERRSFGGGDGAALADALAASWAVPGCFPPVQIDGRWYADGGVASTASADLLLGEDLDEVLVLAPMASSHPTRPRTPGAIAEAVVRRLMSARLDAECAALRRAGVHVRRFDMDPATLAVAGWNFNDASRRHAVLERSIEHYAAVLSSTPV